MSLSEFKKPPLTYSPAPFWSWNADLDTKELTRQIDDMADKGYSGYFMHSRVGLITPYLSKKWHECIKACVDAAKRTGTKAWLYDEDKWPSGFAGGLVPEKGKEYRGKMLRLIEEKDVDKELDDVLATHTHEGIAYAISCYTVPLGSLWFNGASYVDLMNPKVVKEFLDITIDGYKKEVGEHFGKEIPGIFTDEPGYIFLHGSAPCLPWSPCLPDFFKKLKGYDCVAVLKHLFFELDGYKKARFDFFDAATHLFLESFTKQYYNRCVANNLIFTGHFMCEDSLTSQLTWIGAAMPHYEFMHWPGIDKLCRHVEQTVTVKQVSSVAEQLGKERTFCEVFGVAGQHFDFRGRRWIHNWEAALGVNFVNHHLSLYTMMGERKRDYPPNFFHQQPYWPYERGMSDYFGRLNYALTRGSRMVDVCVLHPLGSAWASYDATSGAQRSLNEAMYDRPFQQLTDALLSRRLDFHYGDEMIMENQARVDSGKLIIGKCSYTTIVIPASLTWRQNTVDLLRQFSAQGGKILFASKIPSLIDASKPFDFAQEFKSASFAKGHDEAADTVRTIANSNVSIIHAVLKSDVRDIFIHARKQEDGAVLIFLTNAHQNKTIPAKITLPWVGAAQQLMCETGEVRNCEMTHASDGSMQLEHTFFPGDYLLLKIDTSKKPVTKPSATKAQQIVALDSWIGKPLEDNIMRIDRITFTLDGKKILENAPVHKVWDDHFYKAADGTPFSAEYAFVVKDIPPTGLKAIIEVAHHLDKIAINGTSVKPGAERWHNDVAFEVIDISKTIKVGDNIIHIEGVKKNNITGPGFHRRVKANEFPYKNTEIEAIYIIGDFAVDNWNNESFAIASPKHSAMRLADITTSGYPFYAGRCSFATRVTLNPGTSNITLQFADVGIPCVEAIVNGAKTGAVLWDPFALDITKFVKAGENSIEIIFPTDLYNLMGPNALPQGFPMWCGPGSFREDHSWAQQLQLLRRGIGGVRLVVMS